MTEHHRSTMASPSESPADAIRRLIETAIVEADPRGTIDVIQTVRSQIHALSEVSLKSARVWPGGIVSIIGTWLLLTTFIVEWVNGSVFGTIEFAISLTIGALLILAGPIAIARNVAKADDVVKTVASEYINLQAQMIAQTRKQTGAKS